MNNEVNVPKVKMTDHVELGICKQAAYDALIAKAAKLGFTIKPSFEQVPEAFAEACRAVLVKRTNIELPDESHG